MKLNKHRFSIELPNDLIEDLDVIARKENKSRTEIINEACRLYRDYVHMGKKGSFIPEHVLNMVSATVGTTVHETNNKSNQLLSSIAIQLFVVQKIIAENLEIDRMNLEEYRAQAVDYLRMNNRIFDISKIIG